MNAASKNMAVSRNGSGAVLSQEPVTLRSRMIEILAATANGCLTELGYYPGMPQKLQELEQQNAKWQAENVKLFQDNRSLTLALQGNGAKYATTIRALENQVKGLTQENGTLAKQNERLQLSQPAAYNQLLTEYQGLRDYYALALKEINVLRYNNEVLSGRNPGQPQAAQATWSPSTLQNTQSGQIAQSSQSYAPRAPLPHRLSIHSQPFANTVGFVQQPPTIVPSQPVRHVTGAQSPNSQNQQALRTFSEWTMQNNTHEAVPPNISRSSSKTSNRSQSASRPGSSTGQTSRTALYVNTSPLPASQRELSHLPPTPLSVTTQHQYRPLSSALRSEASSPLQRLASSPMDVVSSAQNQAFPSQDSIPLQPLSATNPGTLLDGDFGTHQGLYTDTSMTVRTENITEHIAINNLVSSASPAEPMEAVTPADVDIRDAPAVYAIPPPALTEGAIKRPSSAMSTAGEQQSKKPRLDNHSAESQQGTSIDDEEEGSEDDEIRVGPDGLRLVEDCIAALFDDDVEVKNAKTCRLCIARFKMGFTMDQPKPFHGSTNEELAQHCCSEHHDAWDTLRHDVE